MKTLVLVNTLQNVNSFVYANHCEFWCKTIKAHPNDQFLFQTPFRMSIDMARNLGAKQALALDFDYLMFIDDDVLIPSDTFTKLQKADKDVIAGLGCIRGFPFDVMAFKSIEKEIKTDNGVFFQKTLEYYNDLPKDAEDNLIELVECGAIGFSCCLIKCDVLRALKPPYFITLPGCTEDVYFCGRIKEELTPEPEIFLHTGVQWGHLLNGEPIEYRTKKKFQDFYSEEAITASVVEDPFPNGRDVAYISKVLAKMA